MNCPKCNSNINQGETFCKVCGYNFNQNQQPQQLNYDQTSNWNIQRNETNNSLNISNNTSSLSNSNQTIPQKTTQNQIQFQNYHQTNIQNQYELQNNIINQEVPTDYQEINQINSLENNKESLNQIYNGNNNDNYKEQQTNQTTPQNNQEISSVANSNNSDDENNDKKIMFKYLLKCYLPFAIIYSIYMLVNKGSINQCIDNPTAAVFVCLIMFFFNEVGFILANFVIVLPFVISSTRKLLKSFNDKQTKLKIVDLIVMITTSITTIFLASKIGVIAFFLVPIIALLYFSNNDISKKSSKKIYFIVIISLLISGFAIDYVFYKVIVTYNIAIIPALSIVFYLLNKNKVNFKIHKVIPIMLVLILLVLSSYQFLLKKQKSFTEKVEKENINLKFEDISYIDELVYADDENVYIISSESSDSRDTEYLSKYNIDNNKFEVLFSNVKNTTSGDGLLFFGNNNNIYMINTKTNEIKKIIDKKYYGNTNHIMLYDSGNLYFSSNNYVYIYNTTNSNINSFFVGEEKEYDSWKSETIETITKDAVITSKCRFMLDEYKGYSSALCAYDYNGNKKLLFRSDENYSSDNVITVDQNIYYYKNEENKIIIKQINENNYNEYSINYSDIYNTENENKELLRINNFDYLGIYKNKVYVVIQYTIKEEDYKYYENIYYFDLLDSENMNNGNIKLNAIRESYEIYGFLSVETGTIGPYTDARNVYFDNQYIYMTNSSEKKIYKYDLNNEEVKQKNTNLSLDFYSINDNYIYSLGDNFIYRIDKNNLKIEKILGEN